MGALPYVELKTVTILGLNIHVFAVLLGIGILTGFLITAYRGRRYGLGREYIARFSLFLLGGGFVGARVGRLLYQPDLVAQALSHPSQLLLGLNGIASFGAYFGGLAGALLFFRLNHAAWLEALQLLDSIGFALPFSWCLGRIGCALVHDHPGVLSPGWLTVRYPEGRRYDLGLLEALFLVLLAGSFLILDRRKRLPGFYFAAYFSVYGPFRFLLDQLHVDPPRYFNWTVDQYGAVVATIAGLAAWLLIARRVHSHDSSSEEPHVISRRAVSEA